jgi:hypothetical protein
MFGWFRKKETKSAVYDYTPSKDIYTSIREREAAEKKRLEKWRKEFKSMSEYNSNNTTVYGVGVGHLPGSISAKNTFTGSYITSTSLSDSAITINGDPKNGSVRIDVPLIVNGRDVMKELDEMRDALLLLKRDVNLEEKYPELKQAYDDYMELYRGLQVAEKFYEIGEK